MAGMAFDNVAVPPTVDGTLAVIKTGNKIGKVQLSFLSQPFRDTLGHTVKGHDLVFNIYESNDREGLTLLTATPITVVTGGQEIANVSTNKGYLIIKGHGVGGGGYCKIDMFFMGMQFFGQVDFDVVGKSGFGLDGDAKIGGTSPMGGSYTNKAGTSEYGASTWPVPPAP